MDRSYILKFIDRHGLMSCDRNPAANEYGAGTTGNGVLFSAVYNAASGFDYPNYPAVRKCVMDGILWRNPDKEQGFDSHDNYTGFAYMMHEQDCASLFWSCAKKFFYLAGNHMWRFPQVWAMMFLSGYNNIFTKIILSPVFLVLYFLQQPKNKDNDENGLRDTSGLQLQYIIIKYLEMMYPVFKPYKRWREKLLKIAHRGEYEFFLIYYGPLHPITKLFEPKQ